MKKKRPIYISYATQKGGAGKTGFTILTASLLHYKMGYNVAVIDCDFPQNSIVKMRERDVAQVKIDDYFKGMAFKQFSDIQKKMYPVVGCGVTNALQKAEKLIEESEVEFDVILFDLPGTVNTKGAFNLLAQMDYIFCPLVADRVVVTSSVDFILIIKENVVDCGISNIKQIYAFWTFVDVREKTRIYDLYKVLLDKRSIPILSTKIPYLVRFRKEISDTLDVFRCTIFPVAPQLLKGSNIDVFVEEVCKKIFVEEVCKKIKEKNNGE